MGVEGEKTMGVIGDIFFQSIPLGVNTSTSEADNSLFDVPTKQSVDILLKLLGRTGSDEKSPNDLDNVETDIV